MKSRIKLARIFSIPVLVPRYFIYLTLLLFPIPVVFRQQWVLYYFSFYAAYLLAIMIHEAGHIITARLLRIRVHAVIISPFGGFTEMSGNLRNPFTAVAVGAGGFLLNILLAGLLVTLLRLLNVPLRLNSQTFSLALFAIQLALMNGFIGVFNILPARPLDGSIILGAVSASFWGTSDFWGRQRLLDALVILSLILAGLFFSKLLAVLGLLLYISHAVDEGISVRQSGAGRANIAGIVQKSETLDPDDTVGTALSSISWAFQGVIPVVDRNGRFLGMLSRSRLQQAASAGNARQRLRSIAEQGYPVIHQDQTINQAIQLMSESRREALPVIYQGKYAGMLYLSVINRHLKNLTINND